MSQIEIDIHNWSKDRLVKWVIDSEDRYEMAGVSNTMASALMVQDLWVMAASFLCDTKANHIEAGIAFGNILKGMRRKVRDKDSSVSES